MDQTVINTDGVLVRLTAEISSYVKRFPVHSFQSQSTLPHACSALSSETAPRSKRTHNCSPAGRDANQVQRWRRLSRAPLHSDCWRRRCGECALDPVDLFLSGPECRRLSNPPGHSCLSRSSLRRTRNKQVDRRSLSLITSGFPFLNSDAPTIDGYRYGDSDALSICHRIRFMSYGVPDPRPLSHRQLSWCRPLTNVGGQRHARAP